MVNNFLVDEVSTEFPKSLSGIFSTLIDWKVAPPKVPVVLHESIWLIKVNKDRCPVCGDIEKSKADWCNPRPDMDCDD